MSGTRERFTALESFRYGTPDQRRWLRDTYSATEWEPDTGHGDVPIKLCRPGAIHQLGHQAMASGPDGVRTLAWALLQLGIKEYPRPARSSLLTRLIRLNLDTNRGNQDYPPDAATSCFGPMAFRLAQVSLPLALDWLIDLAVGSPLAAVEPQPSPVIRGVFLAPTIDLLQVKGFWEQALDLPDFPERLFTDPSHAINGIMFSVYLLRRFADLFDRGPLFAINRLVPVIRDRAIQKSVWTKQGSSGRGRVQMQPASPDERVNMQRRLINSMTVSERRRRARELMFPDGVPNSQRL